MTADRRKQIPKKLRVIISARIDPKIKQELVRWTKKMKGKNLSETVEQAIKHFMTCKSEAA